ncbi:hypothetical protein XENOCAPTIV_027273 [Xenoophorus captivus]|uniref:Uncharacterized protein n=1 Tax=Xenoophorus captivus TaxID=1517983 RepID=A0ABV0SCU9_9TELE
MMIRCLMRLIRSSWRTLQCEQGGNSLVTSGAIVALQVSAHPNQKMCPEEKPVEVNLKRDDGIRSVEVFWLSLMSSGTPDNIKPAICSIWPVLNINRAFSVTADVTELHLTEAESTGSAVLVRPHRGPRPPGAAPTELLQEDCRHWTRGPHLSILIPQCVWTTVIGAHSGLQSVFLHMKIQMKQKEGPVWKD